MSGTSMAAPMVTGTAAMLYSCDASLSLMDVRNRILQSARPLESLSGKVATGGMLDAGAAMP
ncbi:S8 family serine peptidase [Clostridium sp. AM48-13]|uniref:S8 family serine peptidase n=3 Tax=Clostridiaceae TaxID=31979 RepID=UPI0026ABDA07